MAHVSNRHHQTPTVGRLGFRCTFAHLLVDEGRLAIHRVIKVARVFTVYGYQRHVGQIDAVFAIGGANFFGQGGGLRQGGRREAVRHFVLAHRDFNLHPGVIDLTEHFGHAAHGLRIHRRRLGQLNGHDLARRGTRNGVLRHQDVLAVTLVFRRHQPDATFVQQATNDGRFFALDNLGDAAFGAAFAVVAHDARFDFVVVQDRAHFLLRQIQVGLAVGAADEAVTITVTVNGAFDFAHQLGAGGVRFGFVDFVDDMIQDFVKCPGGGIGRRTSFRY